MSRTSCLRVRCALLPGSRGLVPVPAAELTGEMDSLPHERALQLEARPKMAGIGAAIA
jgi:hypothetical protein